VSLTRVTDYKHHATDVLAGSVLGVLVAITVALFLLNLRKYPSIFFQVTKAQNFIVRNLWVSVIS
jgi:membrane-associated phospholipid phosphatase